MSGGDSLSCYTGSAGAGAHYIGDHASVIMVLARDNLSSYLKNESANKKRLPGKRSAGRAAKLRG